MPQLIDPFAFTPTGPFDYLMAYFYSTWMRVDYYAPELHPDIVALVGADSTVLIPQSAEENILTLVPQVRILFLPGPKAAVLVRGTTQPWPELAGEILGSGLTNGPPLYPGRVSIYFRYIASRVWTRINNFGISNNPWLITGHSMGGAIAGLVSIHGAEKVYTIEQPREGDILYALSRNASIKLRLTSDGDLVPLVPSYTTSDFANPPFPFPLPTAFAAYRHWGVHRHIFADGSIIMPPLDDYPTTPAFWELTLAPALYGGDGVTLHHFSDEQCERIRTGIPLAFPLQRPAVYPAVFELDRINGLLNGIRGKTWDIQGAEGFRPTSIRPRPVREPETLPREPPDFQSFTCEG